MKNERFDAIVIPDTLSQRVRKGIRQGEKVYMHNKRKKIMVRAASVAAAVLVCMGIFASQPALAAKIPVIRSIFKMLQGNYSYQGDLDSVAHKLEESKESEAGRGEDGTENDGTQKGGTGENDAGSPTMNASYTKTVDGVTVSISEAYCSVEAIYLSLMITSEEPFP